MNVVVIKYNAGNTRSVLFALKRLGIEAIVSDDPSTIISADKVIFPGVGEASTAMQYLEERNLHKVITGLKQPVLGICLGMQLMCEYSEENITTCLGIFKNVNVKKFKPAGKSLKVPQIGWNSIYNLRSPLFDNVSEHEYCYFVHGYYVELSPYTVGETDYILTYSSALSDKNFFGVQFHPEKSAETGEKILKNFLNTRI